MNILVIGGGAREHTLVWKLAQSPKVRQIYVAPGNAGTAAIAQNLDISPTDIDSVVKAILKYHIELTVIGPEAPLAKGLADNLLIRGMAVFGPTRAAAMIESSKVFAKELMQKYNIPCGHSATFTSFAEARDYVLKQKPPIVVKADGLAAGKGVVIAATAEEAIIALTGMMEEKIFGSAGEKVIIEEYLSGKEMSAFAFTDAHAVKPMVSACDYKRAFDGDLGPNTGGMGSYSPPYFATPELDRVVSDTIMEPVARAMHDEGRPYRGVLFGGLMVTDSGLRVLEFNARFGDPETQVILPRLKTDLVDVMMAIVNNSLKEVNVEWTQDACVGVVMASGGYPDAYQTGFPVSGLNDLDKNILVFHAGTKLQDGQVLTSGGRVLTLVATGKTLAEAREKVYSNLPRVHFNDCHYRKDIAAVRGE